MFLAGFGPLTPEAILLVLALLSALALVAAVWVIGVVSAAVFEAVGLAWLFARILPRSFARRWFLRPWLLSLVLGAVLGASMGLSLKSLEPAIGEVKYWPILLGIPFMALCGALLVVEIVRLIRWIRARRAAVRADAEGVTGVGVAKSEGKRAVLQLLARGLVLLGQLLPASGAALFALSLVFEVPVTWGAVALFLVAPALLGVPLWFVGRVGGRLRPASSELASQPT